MVNYVDDLIHLFEDGIMVKTPKYPEGKHHFLVSPAIPIL